ncbi:MAG: hypothetical protein WA945_01890, partial [Arcobacteraceae bacterium]
MENILKIISEYLNIQITDRNIMAIIEADLESLPQSDVPVLIQYIKQSCNNTNLEYKTGFQKFNFIIENFKKQRVQLSEEDNLRVYNYIDDLNNKVIIIFELIEEQLYKNNISAFADEGKRYISSSSITKDLTAFLTVKGLRVVDKIGRANICRMIKYGRHNLKEEIEKIVRTFAQDA